MITREFELDRGEYSLACRLDGPDERDIALRPGLVLSLASDRLSSLENPAFSDAATAFVKAGHYALSFDLPNHGDRVDEHGEGIAGMCAAFLAGRDPFQRVVADGVAAIDACLTEGIVADDMVFVSGVSRGGYCALRLAAEDRRVAGVAGIAPVTDWRILSEFAAVRDSPEVAALALDNWATSLATRPVYLAIGNRDNRVGTVACVRFAQRVLDAEAAGEVVSSQLRLHVVDSPGHALDTKWRLLGARFLLELCKQG